MVLVDPQDLLGFLEADLLDPCFQGPVRLVGEDLSLVVLLEEVDHPVDRGPCLLGLRVGLQASLPMRASSSCTCCLLEDWA